MRSHRAIALTLILLAATPLAGAASGPADAAETFLALKRAALGSGVAPPFPDALAARSALPVEAAAAAWTDAADGEGDARLGVLRAEAELLRLAWANALAAEEAGDAEAVAAWLALALSRVDAGPRAVPVAALLAGDVAREPLEEALRSIVAARAREEVVQAALLRRAGLAPEANASAEGALHLLDLLRADAADLPDGLREPFLAALAAPSRDAEPATALVAPLVALELDRDVERLDELGARTSDAAFVVARAAREDPALLDRLASAARDAYAAERGPLYLAGEGELDAVDAAWAALAQAAAARDAAGATSAAAAVHAAVRPLALLERGVVLKVETGGLQPGREHLYSVWIVRPTLEGLASWTLALRYDPAVLRVENVTPRARSAGFASEIADGLLTLRYEGEPLRRSALVAHLHLVAVGAPGARSTLAIEEASFAEPDGDAAEVFRLRDGSVEVALLEIDPTDDALVGAAAESAPEQRTPLGALAAVALALAALRRRRA